MIEQVIYLEGIDPAVLYGINNNLLDKLKLYFPKLKVVARGNEIKVFGEKVEIDKFEEAVEFFGNHIIKFNKLSKDDLDKFFSDDKIKGNNPDEPAGVLVYGSNGKLISARTINQKKLVEKYLANDLLFAIGPAGTGKTYTAIALAVRAFKNREVQKIILTRPAVEAGEKLGFLPGDVKEKLDPYLQPLYDALNDMMPARKLKEYITDGSIQIAPLAFMRGRTLDNAAVILDEAQNATTNQLKMFLTRMGSSAKFIVTGDVTQIDLPDKRQSGLISALDILKDINGLSIIYFDNRDIIRHKLVKLIVKAYERSNIEKER